MEIRICLFEVVGEGIVYGDVEASGECDLRIFRGLGEWVVGWELGPEVWIGFLLCMLVLWCFCREIGMDRYAIQPIPFQIRHLEAQQLTLDDEEKRNRKNKKATTLYVTAFARGVRGRWW